MRFGTLRTPSHVGHVFRDHSIDGAHLGPVISPVPTQFLHAIISYPLCPLCGPVEAGLNMPGLPVALKHRKLGLDANSVFPFFYSPITEWPLAIGDEQLSQVSEKNLVVHHS